MSHSEGIGLTKPPTRNGLVLAIFIVLFPQLLVAEDLVGLADLETTRLASIWCDHMGKSITARRVELLRGAIL